MIKKDESSKHLSGVTTASGLIDLEPNSLNKYVVAATSDNTRRAYRSAIRQFEKWGGRLPSEPNVLVGYLNERAGQLNPRSIELHLTAIRQWHITQSMSDPTRHPMVAKTMNGIRRIHGRPKVKAKALSLNHMVSMLSCLRALPDSNKKARDIALLLVGFFGAFRRSELVSINIEDLQWEADGVIVTISKSKTDQESEGLTRGLPLGNQLICPVNALKNWIDRIGDDKGPLFKPINKWDQIQNQSLSPGAINVFLKQLGKKCQFDFADELSSHSFRRGMSTSAAREKIDFALIKKQGGWKNDATVWGYIEEGQSLSENATLQLMEKMIVLLNQRID